MQSLLSRSDSLGHCSLTSLESDFRYCLWVCAKSFQSCPTLCDPMDCSPPGSSVRGILQARTLEWVAVPHPGDLPHPAIELESLTSPALAGGLLTSHTTWEARLLTLHIGFSLLLLRISLHDGRRKVKGSLPHPHIGRFHLLTVSLSYIRYVTYYQLCGSLWSLNLNSGNQGSGARL